MTDGIASSYPSTDYNLGPTHRFQVLRVNRRNPGNYLIKDFYLEKDTDVPKSWLKDPEFDLVGWYRWYVDQQGLFKKKYCEAHPGLHQPHETMDTGPPEENRKLNSSSPSGQEDDWDDIPELDAMSSSEFETDEFFEKHSEENTDFDDLPDLDLLTDDSESEEEDTLQHSSTYGQEADIVLIKRIQTDSCSASPIQETENR